MLRNLQTKQTGKFRRPLSLLRQRKATSPENLYQTRLAEVFFFERRKGIGHRGSEVLKETVLVSADVFNNIGLLHFVLFLSTGHIQLTWLPP